MVLIDGHHRVRYGPKYNVRDFPAIVLIPVQTALAYRKNDVLEMMSILDEWVSGKLDSFRRRRPDLPLPPLVYFNKNGYVLTISSFFLKQGS